MIMASDFPVEGKRMNAGGAFPDNADCSGPPRPRLVFRVGIVGHRPDRLGKADLKQLAGCIDEILRAVKAETLAVARECKAIYDSATPMLKAVSPLAEGADRIFAETALEAGFALDCVMPFPQAEYENDFGTDKRLEENSLARFQSLLGRTGSRFELDGTRSDDGDAYGTCGRVVINQSDLLIVVWDGERQGKPGGTEETLDDARNRGVPVIWVDAQAPHSRQLLDRDAWPPQAPHGGRAVPDGSGSAAVLNDRVRQTLELPKETEPMTKEERARTTEPAVALREFYAEHRPGWSAAVAWSLFLQLIADTKLPMLKFKVQNFEDSVTEKWPRDSSTVIGRLVDDLRKFYAWPDKLAVLYGNRYRSAFLLGFLIAAGAVALALYPPAARLRDHEWPEITFIGLEFLAILYVLFLVIVGQRWRWHERWIDYRLTAELVRHLRLVAPLCGERPLPRIPAQLVTFGEPAASWMAWYVRAVERALQMPSAVVDKTYLDAYLAQLKAVVAEQIEYHERNELRCAKVEKRLEICGVIILGVIVFACGLHFVIGARHEYFGLDWLSAVLTFLCGFLPALGAALAGIMHQGEFRSLTRRSRSMRTRLLNQLKEIEILETETGNPVLSPEQRPSRRALNLAGTAAGLLVSELLDWRVILLDQPLRPPA
jgi:hypothetical protein